LEEGGSPGPGRRGDDVFEVEGAPPLSLVMVDFFGGGHWRVAI
jgi:hypothetical protein